MRPFRFVHAADLHLDSPFRGMMKLPSVVRERVRESTFEAFYELVRLAIKEKVDFVLISGDVYDLSDRSLRAQIRFQKGMIQLAEQHIHVYIVHGNHDPEDGRRALLAWPETVHFLSCDEVQIHHALNRDMHPIAAIHGMSYPTMAVSDNIARRMTPDQSGLFQIGLLHANVEGDPNHDNYAPCTLLELQRSGMHYWALGHVHTRRVLSENPWVVYPGNTQGRSVREIGAKGCYVVHVTEHGAVSADFHAVDAIRWVYENISIEGINTAQQLKDKLEEHIELLLEQAEGRSVIVRFDMTGRGPIHKLLQNNTQMQELTDEIQTVQTERIDQDPSAPFVWIESCRAHTGIQVDLDQLQAEPSFLGEVVRIADGLGGQEQLWADFYHEAMGPLLGNAKANKYVGMLDLEEQQELLRTAREMALELLFDETGWKE